MMRARLWLLAAALSLSACVGQPVVYDDARAAAAEGALAAFRADPAVAPFFEQALAYAVFADTWRAGAGFGAGFGNGWLFEGGQVVGRAVMLELMAGPHAGVLVERKILFFRSAEALDQFKRGRFEFTGQASAVAASAGGAVTPSYHPDVAMFVAVRGGLMLEATVGSQRYDYFPLAPRD